MIRFQIMSIAPDLTAKDYVFWAFFGILVVGIIAIMAFTWPRPPK